MKVVSIIPARGGSKGIHKKNIIDLNGHPLIYYTISASLKSGIEETWISTEDEQIKEVAIQCGAQVIDRPIELATDDASSEGVILHFADNIDFDVLCFIQATSPLLNNKDLNQGISLMSSGKYDSVFSVTITSDILTWTKDMTPMNYDPLNRGRRQTREDWYIENGAFYMTTKESLLKSKCRISGKIGFVQLPYWRSFQVDDYDDLEGISKLMKEY